MGISKCRSRSKLSVWWPGLSGDIVKMVNDYVRCKRGETKKYEPLKPIEWPSSPWHNVGSVLFEYNGTNHLLVSIPNNLK